MKRRGVRGWFRLPVTDRVMTEADVDAELTAHIEARVEELTAQGLTEDAARVEAERRLGGKAKARYALIREAWNRDRALSLRDRARALGEDVRYGARAVFRERGYASVVIITLALGIGANATMFGLLDRLLLSGPAHVVAPEELHRFYLNVQYNPTGDPDVFSQLNYPLYTAFRDHVPSLRDVSGYSQTTLTLGSGIEARHVDTGAVTAGFFDLTGARPILGRFFDAAEDAPPTGELVIVLGHRLWQQEFGGRADIIGESVELSNRPYTVVGVAPEGFTGVELAPRDAWVPLSTVLGPRMGDTFATSWGGFYMQVAGRLEPGANAERAAAEATAAHRAAYDGPHEPTAEASVSIAHVRFDSSGKEPLEARVSRWLVAVSAIVLLVACANVANLYFARGLRRRREIAVRLALGITRGRLVRLLLVESLILAVLGGIAALAVAYWGAEIVRNVLLPNVDWTTSPLNARVLGLAAALTALVAVVTGLVPALQAARPELAPALTGSVHAPPAPGRARNVLAIMQAAFCVILLVGAGLFVRSLWSVERMDLGLDASRVLAVRVEWQAAQGLNAEEQAAQQVRRRAFFDQAIERLRAVPGVEYSSAAIGSPFHSAFGVSVRAEGIDSLPRLPAGGPYASAASADYFATLGTPLLRGRMFERGEGAGTDPVAVVNRTMAETLWPDSDAIGRCLYIGSGADRPCSRIVGIVADARRFRLEEEAAMQYYVPLGQEAEISGITLFARTAGRPDRLAEPVRRALYGIEPTLRFVRPISFSEILDPQRRPWKLGATLFVICGGLALLIAIIGLYSVIAYLVLHRTHEIGVRMALGAERHDVVGMILRQALTLAGIGVVIGLSVSVYVAPMLQPLLFDTAARDGAVMGGVTVTLAGAALLAGIIPALRASRVAPTQALRDS